MAVISAMLRAQAMKRLRIVVAVDEKAASAAAVRVAAAVGKARSCDKRDSC